MTTKRKTAPRRASRTVAAAPEKKKQALRGLTALHFSYSPEPGIVRVNLQQDVTLQGEKQRVGRDRDCLVTELPAKIQTALDNVLELLAAEVGATPFKAAK